MSEILVYTAIAVVFSRHDDEDGDGVAGGGVLWRPVADGAWTQLHLFLEMEHASHGASPRGQLMRNFRLVAWVLDTGKVIVNDVVCAKCMWAPIDELLWQFTSGDGHCYGFRFHSVEQADECAQVVGGILHNIDEIRRLVKKMFQTRTTTRDFLALLYDIGFFTLDSERRSTMIESAQAAVASLQSTQGWSRGRHTVPSVYPKESASHHSSSPRSCPSPRGFLSPQSERAVAVVASEFSEVQAAAMVATDAKKVPAVARAPEFESDEFGDDVAAPSNPTKSKADELWHVLTRSSSRDASETSTSGCTDSVSSSIPRDRISMPYKTRQELHVTYNNDLARYEGLPWAWRRLNHQFGVPLEAVPKRHVHGYPCKIPSVLQMLKESLITNDGLETEGVFRLAPDKQKCASVKQSINDGTFGGCADVHIIASLIKVWFRELPESLFNAVPEKLIYRTCDLKDPHAVIRSIDAFPPLHASLVLWLLDLMAKVARHEEQNKMSARNLAIVISPNLFSIESDNPMYALTMSQKVAEFTYVLLEARLRLASR